MFVCRCFFFFKQKTSYYMRISDWSSDVCSSDLKTCRRLTPKFVLQYEPSSNLLAYASYARCFKSGGFNGQASAPDETVGFDPEIADNFEIGAKVDLFDRRLRLNVAAFYVK